MHAKRPNGNPNDNPLILAGIVLILIW